MKRLLVFLFLVLAAAGGAAAYYYNTAQEITISYVLPVRGPVVQAVYATGTTEPGVMLPISAHTPGRLMVLNVDEGHAVTKGQVLARLEDDPLQARLTELKARAEFSKKEYARQKEIFDRGFGTKQAVDRARADEDAAAAAVASAAAEAALMELRAPENGTVIRRDGEIGEMINANQPVFWMACCAPLRVTAEVDEEDIPLVRPGQKVLLRANSYPDQTLEGHVQSITPKGDPVARSYRVRIRLDDDGTNAQKSPLMIGMTIESNIIISETQDALLIPSEAVRNGQVWVLLDGRLTRRKIETGARGDEQIAVLSGLTAEDKIVINAPQDAQEGQMVRAVAKKFPAAAPRRTGK